MKLSCGGSVCDRLPPLSTNYPWLVAQNFEDDITQDQIFYTIYDTCHYQCRIPVLLGKRIRGCFHGWVILSCYPKNVMWSLWNPVTSKIICFPPLILKDGDYESIEECCLSAPPDDPSSVLLLTRTDKPFFVFCRLDRKKKGLRWTEMSYAKQLKGINIDGRLLYSLTCCNGKLFALNTDASYAYLVIQIDIVVKDSQVLIRLMLFGQCPFPSYSRFFSPFHFLKGSCKELFCITLGSYDKGKITAVSAVFLFKLDTTSIKWEEIEGLKDMNTTCTMWEEVEDLKDAMFFEDLVYDFPVFYSPAVAAELGGYIHILGESGKVIYSYHVKDKTITLSSMPSKGLPTSYNSMWECGLGGEHREAKCTLHSKQDKEDKDDKIVVRSVKDDDTESHILKLPIHLLETIIEFCVGVEYMYFHATCKRWHLAAPFKQWSDKAALTTLNKYSVVSPWLMVVDSKEGGIITFTDPLFGDKYFMKKSHVSIHGDRISCSRFGWLLFYSNEFTCLVFFNPFTSDIYKLPHAPIYLDSLCFSAPPTSPDCMVAGFTITDKCRVYIHFLAREPSWRMIRLHFGGVDPYSFRFPTFYSRDIYTLCNEGELYCLKDLDREDYSWKQVVAEAPQRSCESSPQHFLVKYDQDLLLVIIGEIGEFVGVFKLNDSIQGWEKINSLGRRMIYICPTTCLCIEAKTSKMENKIYFPRVHSKNGKMVCYSLETCKYHTFSGENIQELSGDLLGTTQYLSTHVWIEPGWS